MSPTYPWAIFGCGLIVGAALVAIVLGVHRLVEDERRRQRLAIAVAAQHRADVARSYEAAAAASIRRTIQQHHDDGALERVAYRQPLFSPDTPVRRHGGSN